MPFPLPPDALGSVTPALEGAPRSQSHTARSVMATAPLLHDPIPLPTEIGGEHDATAST